MADNTINNDMTMGGATGAFLAGRYRVVRQLGQGGMGSVWLAEDEKLDGFKVAIKMLPSVLVNNKRAYAQVKAEALVSLKLSHPNIVTVRAFEEEGGSPFLVMDYIDGQTLDDYLAEKGTLTEDETVKLLKPVAAALDYAHTQGVVHRDVKPGNVMIRKDGTPFVLDFGIAREIQETMTRVTGKLSSGTLLYMSPEQLNGAAPKPAQDIYSFAAMAYECLKGEPPFSRGGVEDQIKHKMPEALGPQFIKCGLGVMAGLSKSPEARPATCAAVLEKGAKSRGVGDGAPAHKTRIAVVGVLLVLVALIGVGLFCQVGSEKNSPQPVKPIAAKRFIQPIAVERPVVTNQYVKVGQSAAGILVKPRSNFNLTEWRVNEIRKKVYMCAINVTPEGKVCVGFTDHSNYSHVSSYYLSVGEEKDGWKLLRANPREGSATLLKDGVEVNLKMDN